jgi:hypothetical protein
MKNFYGMIAVVSWLISIAGYAATPANAPAGTTGLCNDGSYYSGPTKKGACRGHKGVKEWYGTAQAAPAAQPPTTTQAPAANTPKGAAKPAANPPPATVPAKPESSKGTTAVGGGPGQVWVNLPSKVYHCPGTRWYGKTKQGEYMSEAEAKAKGFKPDHGKACG